MNIIETVNLTKNYGKSRGIIDINLNVNEGEIFGFIGSNGSGKSTLIRTLLNFLFPTNGSGKIFGKDISTESKYIKEFVGYVPSEVKYYGKLNVKDIIKYISNLKKNQNKEQIKNLINILDIDLNKKISELSLGNKKKIAILQAFIGNPKLLILDEPTNGLDPLMQSELFDMLIDAKEEGKTIFLSSHNLSEVENLCGRVGIIKEGRLIETMDLQFELRNFGKIVDIEGNIPVKFIEDMAKEILEYKDHKYKFTYSGDMDIFIKAIAKYNIKNISIRNENLEDIFIKYYKKEDN